MFRKPTSKDEVKNTLEFFGEIYPEKKDVLKKFITNFRLIAPINHGDILESEELTQIIDNQKQNKMKTPVNENNDYNTILNGKIAVYQKEKTSTSKTITSSKTGQSREYEMFKDLSGILKGIYVNTKKVGEVDMELLYIKLYCPEEKKNHYLEMFLKSNYAKDFLFRLPNILDLSKVVKLNPYKIKDEEKSKEKNKECFNEGIAIIQEDKKIKRYYTKETPNDLPPLLEIKVKGKPSKWDDTEQLSFLEDLVKQYDLKIRSIKPVEETETEEKSDDDLPF